MCLFVTGMPNTFSLSDPTVTHILYLADHFNSHFLNNELKGQITEESFFSSSDAVFCVFLDAILFLLVTFFLSVKTSFIDVIKLKEKLSV